MVKLFIVFIFTFCVLITKAQSEIKNNGTFCLSLLLGYETIPNTNDINQKVTLNNFGPIKKTNYDFGLQLLLAKTRHIIKVQAKIGWPTSNNSNKKTPLKPSGILISYGYDLLPKLVKTYAYPFFGFKYQEYSVSGKSLSGDELYAFKATYGIAAGFGLLHFINPRSKGILNHIDINLGANIGLLNEKWKKAGSQFVQGTFNKNINYFFTVCFGKGW